jgi:hypothetical protein
MAKSPTRFVVLLLSLIVVAGCSSAPPSSEPTFSCTPEDSGTPYPCQQVQYEESIKRVALYVEAEAVYRKYQAEDERIWRSGGVAEATPVMQETLTADALSSALSIYQALKSTNTKLVGGEVNVAWVKRVPKEIGPGMTVALQVCVDSHTASLVSKGEQGEPAGYTSDTMSFSLESGLMRIQTVSGDEVESC